MDKNLAYKSLHLNYIKGLNVNKVSAEVGLTSRVVSAIIKGVRMPEVATDFFTDRKKGDFSRTYPLPKYRKLNKIDYVYLEQRYMSLIYKEMVSLHEVRSYLLEDDVEPAQAQKLMQTLTDFYNDNQGEMLDVKLQNILEILSQDAKWKMTDEGLSTVYPVPVLDENYNIVKVTYQEKRAFYIPDELWSRYVK